MKIRPSSTAHLQTLLLLGAVGSMVTAASAHPYASGITNNGGTIQFILNESADNVKVAFDNGSSTNDLGALGAGVRSFALGSHTNYQIIVSKVGTGVPSQISVDTNNFVKFNSPRGVAVNLNAKGRNFGRIYVANSASGTSAGRPVGDGLYVLNSDQSDALGKGDTVTTGGVNFGTGGSSDPWKIGLGPDDLLYVNNFSTAAATTWAFDPDLTTGTLVLEGIGLAINPTVHTDSASTPVVRGSLATGDLVLWVVDGQIPPWNSVVRWDIGAGPLPWNTPPTILGNAGIPSVADLNTDVDVGPDGKIYTSINRSAGTDVPSIKVFDTDGVTLLWDSITAGGTPDPLRQARAIMVSPNGKYLASVHDNNKVSILPLINGLPDLANLSTIDATPTTTIGRDIAWDAANNLYTVSSGQGLLRVYSLGLTTMAVTSNDASGTNGSFQLVTPSTTVSVQATTPAASETGPTPGVFTITRSGDLSGPLTVNFVLSGTASNGVDYASIPSSIVIDAGSASKTITVTPVDDAISELTETVVLTLKGGGSYSAVAPSAATVTIEDNDPQLLSVSVTAANSMYERHTNDYATFRVTRMGATNVPSYEVTTLSYSGLQPNVDFTPFSGQILFDPGVVTVDFNISPLDNAVYTGNRVLNVGLADGPGYTATTNIASATIIDDENPPETVLFSDSLIDASSSNGWTVRFMANNLIDDYLAAFGYDFTQDFVAPAPNGASTALRVNVNKDEATPNGAAGINLYPTGKSFSGNYALRFQMNLVQNNGAGTTEFATFGINHSGNKTNWFIQSGDLTANTPTDQDGLWFAVVADASGSSPADYVLYAGNGLTNAPLLLRSASSLSFVNAYKKPPYSPDGGAGSPACKTGAAESIWSDVEVRQLGNVVKMSINKIPVFNYTNTTAYTKGDIMLGYVDPYASIGAANGGVYYSNVRVVNLGNPTVVSSGKSGSNFNLSFTDASDDPASSFRIVGAAAVTGSYTNMSATITRTGVGAYSATLPYSSSEASRFLRVQHLP
jgi:hypothetical protein